MSKGTATDKNLNPVLNEASAEDLAPLVEYILDKISESLTAYQTYNKLKPKHNLYPHLIAKEIRDMGGNSFANLWRGEGPSYHEIVCDVASKLKAPYNKNKSIEDIEDSILETILTTALDSMTEAERRALLSEMEGKGGMSKAGASTAVFVGIFRAGGFLSYQLTLIIANQIAKAVLGHGLKFATNTVLVRYAAILTGPVGLAITGIWTAVDIAGPAYKVTIPCVIHISMLRKKFNSMSCTNCGSQLPDKKAKFCNECGTKVTTKSGATVTA